MAEWKRMNKWAYYNEIDPYCVAWLKNLMDAGEIPRGVIDTRSIEDVTPNDLYGFRQCHFFAGLGGWAYALDLAGWPRDRPVWTGSCPCQPFSAAGKGTGFADERHLWPAWQHLIAQCRPGIIFGEQVASKAVDAWIDLVHADLEGMGYAFGCIPFPSAGVGAPHVRDRTYWVADADDTRLEGRFVSRECADKLGAGPRRVACRPWADADWLGCTDGKWRPVESGSQPLAHGVPNRVGRLRAYGNAINPHQAAEFVAAYAEAKGLMGLERAA